MTWEKCRSQISKRDYEILLEYEEGWMSRIILPALASKERVEIMQIDHNPFVLADASSRIGSRISKPAVLQHISQMIEAGLLERIPRGYGYTSSGRRLAKFAKRFGRDLSAFGDRRTSPKKWEILSRLSFEEESVSQRMLAEHTDLPESSLSRFVGDLADKHLVDRVEVGQMTRVSLSGHGRDFVQSAWEQVDLSAENVLRDAASSGTGTRTFHQPPTSGSSSREIPVLTVGEQMVTVTKATY